MPARIVQLSDLHLGATVGAPSRGSDVWRNLDDVLAALPQLEPIDLLVLTGDLASQRRLATYQQLRQRLAAYTGRLRVLPGNHDSRRLLRAAFGDLLVPGRRSANFDVGLGGWRLLGLDSVQRPFVKGRFGSEQLRWLDARLQATPQPVLLFMHHPPLRIGCWWLDKDLPGDHQRFFEVVHRGVVHAIACGHVHQEFEGLLAHARVWTAPAVAYQFRPRSRWPAAIASLQPAWRVIDLEDRVASTRVVRLGG